MKKADIDEIVMIGGSTYIPKVRNIVEEYFGKPLNYSVNPDEAV
jgi:molecular chaperone DnaK (HSP70)